MDININIYDQSLVDVIEDSKQNYDKYGLGYLFLAFDYIGVEHHEKILKRQLNQVFSLNPEFVIPTMNDTNYSMCYFHRDDYTENIYGVCKSCDYRLFPVDYFYVAPKGASKLSLPLNSEEIIKLSNTNMNTLYVGITTMIGLDEII